MKKFSLKPWHAMAGLIITFIINDINRNAETIYWSLINHITDYLFAIFTIMFLYLVIRNLFRWLKEIIVGRSQLPPSTPPHQVSQQREHHQE